jgi:hypothetical protein
MGSLANLFNLNLTTDLPSLHKIGGKYLGKLEIPAHAGSRTVSQTYNNVLANGTPYILTNTNNAGWTVSTYEAEQGQYPIDVWVGSVHYTVGWWNIQCKVTISGKNIIATIITSDSSSASSSTQKYNFPATSMEVAFIEMSEPV